MIEFNESYMQFLESQNPLIICYGGSEGGKSWATAFKKVYRAITEPGIRLLAMRKVRKDIKDSIWNLIKKTISGMGIEYTENKSDFTITLKNKSEILFKGLDDSERAKSMEGIDSVWLEEANQFTETDFDFIDRTIRGNAGKYKQLIMTFNPISKRNWIYKRFFEQINKDALYMRTTYKDNAFANIETIKKLKAYKNTRPNLYNVYCLGEWGSLEGAVYNKWDIVPDSYPKNGSLFYGLDFGYSDPCAMVEIYEYDGEFRVNELIYKSRMVGVDIIETLDRLQINKHRPIYCDNSRPELIATICKHGYEAIAVKKGKDSVIEGVDFVKGKQLHITESSVNTIEEIEGYVYAKDREGKPNDRPEDGNDHAMDAIRYAIDSHLHKPDRTIRAIDWLNI